MRKSNYDKFPSTPLEGNLIKGWDSIFQTLKEKLAGKGICVIECYQGVYIEELEKHLPALEAVNIL